MAYLTLSILCAMAFFYALESGAGDAALSSGILCFLNLAIGAFKTWDK